MIDDFLTLSYLLCELLVQDYFNNCMKGSQIFMKGSIPFKKSLVTTLTVAVAQGNASLDFCKPQYFVDCKNGIKVAALVIASTLQIWLATSLMHMHFWRLTILWIMVMWDTQGSDIEGFFLIFLVCYICCGGPSHGGHHGD